MRRKDKVAICVRGDNNIVIGGNYTAVQRSNDLCPEARYLLAYVSLALMCSVLAPVLAAAERSRVAGAYLAVYMLVIVLMLWMVWCCIHGAYYSLRKRTGK